MTWDEFKAYVDGEIANQGKGGSIPVGNIDVTDPDEEFICITSSKELEIYCP